MSESILVDGAASGGIMGIIIITVKELIVKYFSRNGKAKVTKAEMHVEVEKVTEEQLKKKKEVDRVMLENQFLKHQITCTRELQGKIDKNHGEFIQAMGEMKEALHNGLGRVYDTLNKRG